MSVGEPVGETDRCESATSGTHGADSVDPAAGKSVRGIQRRHVTSPRTDADASPFPPVELPAPVERIATSAVAKMGWQGVVLPQMRLAGRRVVVVARLRTAAHAERICLGSEPVADRATVATWMWPEFAPTAPPAAVDIVGVLGVARHWRTALASAAPFSPYCETGVVVPWDVAMTPDYLRGCLTRAWAFGVSVLTADPDGQANLDQGGTRNPAPVAESALTRWLNELVYQRLLDTIEETVAAD